MGCARDQAQSVARDCARDLLGVAWESIVFLGIDWESPGSLLGVAWESRVFLGIDREVSKKTGQMLMGVIYLQPV